MALMTKFYHAHCSTRKLYKKKKSQIQINAFIWPIKLEIDQFMSILIVNAASQHTPMMSNLSNGKVAKYFKKMWLSAAHLSEAKMKFNSFHKTREKNLVKQWQWKMISLYLDNASKFSIATTSRHTVSHHGQSLSSIENGCYIYNSDFITSIYISILMVMECVNCDMLR